MTYSTNRHRTNIGDIFQTIGTKVPHYIQLVAIDAVSMNSDVIVVFSDRELTTPIFYMHTTVKAGVKEGLWEKIDNRDVKINLSKLIFRTYVDDEWHTPAKPYWRLWVASNNDWKAPNADKDWKKVSPEKGKNTAATRGSIFPPDDVIYRIENGESRFKLSAEEMDAKQVTEKELRSITGSKVLNLFSK